MIRTVSFLGFGFGATANTSTTGGLFCSTPSTSSGLFGQQNTSIGGGLFGNTTAGGCGQQMATGTAVVKYYPVAGTGVVVKDGAFTNVNIKYHCITCMKEYESKSLEELRLDDYVAGQKHVFWFHYKKNKPLFGGITGGCGQQMATGTAVVKYNPMAGTDVVVKAGTSTNVNIKHHCITCMKEYESKSLEELRLDDYVAGRKHVFWFHYKKNKPLFGGITDTISFGGDTQTNTQSVGLFGANKPGLGATPTPDTKSFSGDTQTNTQSMGLFGANKPAVGATPTPGKGFFSATTTQPPAFGTNTTTFGFGANTQNQTVELYTNELTASTGFGSFSSKLLTKSNTTASSFATTTSGTGLSASFQPKPTNPGLGTLETTGSLFQQPAQNTIRTDTKSFSGDTQTNTQSMGLFGANKPAVGATPTPGKGFFSATTTQPPAFGTNTTTFGFGANTQNQTVELYTNELTASTGFGSFSSKLLTKSNTTASSFATTTSGTGLSASFQPKPTNPGLGTLETTGSLFQQPAQNTIRTDTISFGGDTQTNTQSVGLFGANKPGLGATPTPDTKSFSGDTQTNTQSMGLFGANKPAVGATPTPGKGFFSATTTQPPAFGTNTTTFGFGANTQNQTVELYTNELTASTGFGSFSSKLLTKSNTTASSFATTTSGTGLSASFQPKPTNPGLGTLETTGSLFQQPAQNTIRTDTISFGGDTQTNTQSVGLFGANKPGLGATPTPDTKSFSGDTQTNTQSMGLFGANKPAVGATPTPGKGFFSATTTQAPAFGTNTTTFGFGANTQNQTVELYTNELTASTGFGSFSSKLLTKSNTTASSFATTTSGTGLSASFQPKPTNPGLGTLETTGSLFQQPAQNTIRTDTISFGGDTQTNTQSVGLFGANKPGLGATPTPDTKSFSGDTQTNTQSMGLFGANKPAVGATPTPGKGFFSATTTQAPAFGTNTTTFGFGANTQNQTVELYTNELTASTGFGSFSSKLLTKSNTTASSFATTTSGTGLSASFQPKPTNPGLGTLETTGSLFQQPAQNTVRTDTISFGGDTQTNTQSVGLFGANKPGLGATPTPDTISFSGDTQTNTQSMSLFGANKPAVGATPTPGKGFFSATTTQAPAFGTNTTTFGFGANTQNQTVGLYTNELTASTGFGSFSSKLLTKSNTTASSFATTTSGTGLSASFQPKPTNPGLGTLETTGSLFQQPAQNTVRTDTISFGGDTQTNTQSVGLFGANKPGLGATPTPDTISFSGDTQTNTQSMGLFGANKPAVGATPTPGKGFFSATTTQAPAFGTNTTTFGFGANTQNQTVGLYTNELTASTGFGSFSSKLLTKSNTTASSFATTTSATGLSASLQPKPTNPGLGTLGTKDSLFQQPAQNTTRTESVQTYSGVQVQTLVPEERSCEEYVPPDAPTTSDEVLQPTKPSAVLDSHRVSPATRQELTDRPVPHKHDKKSLCDVLEESDAILEKITLLEAKLEETRVETQGAGDDARCTTD